MDQSNERNGQYHYFDGEYNKFNTEYLKKKLCKKRYLVEHGRKELLCSPGDEIAYCYYLKKGSMICYEIIKGKRRIYDRFVDDSLLLASHAMYDRRCALYYEATQDCELYFISIDKVRSLMKTDPQFLRAVLVQTTRDLLVSQDLLRKSNIHNVSWLVSDFVIVMSGQKSFSKDGVIYLSDRFTQKQLADMLFIDRITCFKELHKLEDLGYINMQSGNIGIVDLEALKEYRKTCEE